MSVEVLCGLFGKRRQWYYASRGRVVSERQRRKLLLVHVVYYRWRWPRLGGVKLHVILKEELGEEITHGRDSFLRFLSSEGLTLPKLKRRHTTDSNHPYRKYPNLVIGLDIQQVNQVWVSDITYVWIAGDVLYLHLVSDMYSHAIIGWSLSETMEAKHTVEALEMAIRTAGGDNLCGTIHHSDRGAQYACSQYVGTLVEHHIRISMTERYNPTDNALAERHTQDGEHIPERDVPGLWPGEGGDQRCNCVPQLETATHEHWNEKAHGSVQGRGAGKKTVEEKDAELLCVWKITLNFGVPKTR
ncbi:IS3 family transposase [Hallella sp.]|uniref:IS3 family transposase n=1 Tax=Hallella sp. TaxID=2980186 RepID=UPI002848BAF9|nr:IS3 family transposase [Hallella sp.]MDR3844578.1 IS3 family transposase [Hallella sp.]